jgi:hypothetical protein
VEAPSTRHEVHDPSSQNFLQAAARPRAPTRRRAAEERHGPFASRPACCRRPFLALPSLNLAPICPYLNETEKEKKHIECDEKKGTSCWFGVAVRFRFVFQFHTLLWLCLVSFPFESATTIRLDRPSLFFVSRLSSKKNSDRLFFGFSSWALHQHHIFVFIHNSHELGQSASWLAFTRRQPSTHFAALLEST